MLVLKMTYTIVMKFRKFWQGIKNILAWFPVIYNDRQWDWSFFLLVLQKKLELMQDYYKNHACYVGAEAEAENIDQALALVRNILRADDCGKAKQEDLDELCLLLSKHLYYWWD